ncbi:hypothetical protein V6N11_047324 [Hibiscus sabdariffa]|uniref:Uncharacterized protein n=1 Tax=Hibiscus sabdariffa TaxID=183260 RepID=A0ABR2PC44_9ROSI
MQPSSLGLSCTWIGLVTKGQIGVGEAAARGGEFKEGSWVEQGGALEGCAGCRMVGRLVVKVRAKTDD